MSVRAGLAARFWRAWAMDDLAAWPQGTPDEEESFDAWARGLAVNYALLATSLMLGAIVAWGLVDRQVLPDEAHVAAFTQLRLGAATTLLAAMLALALSDTVRRSVLVVGPITSAAVAAQIGAALGPLGVDGAPWYADALIAPIPIAMLPLPLGRRLLATGPTSVALAASWVATAPDGRTATTYMAGQLSFSLFSWLLTVVMGELFYRTVRRSYFQQRQLDHARREVERINATLVERVEAQTRQLRQLAHQLQHAQESERRHLSRELHDELGQDLTAIRLTLSLVDQRFITAPSAIGPLLAQLGQLVRRATATTRTIVEGLRPKVVEDLGLLAGASWLCRTLHESSGVPCELHGEPGCDEGLAPDAAVALFRVLQESMSNALKHGHPEHVRVEVTRREHELTVSVTDDGGGFDPAAPARGLGMVGMRERVRAFGGALDVRSAPGQGSVVQATVPVHPERAATTADEETSRASARVHRGRP